MPGAGTKQQISKPALSNSTAGEQQITPSAVLSSFEQICVALPASGAIIAVRELAGLQCTVSFGKATAVCSRLPMDSILTRQCIEAGEVVVCEDTENDPRIHPSAAKALSFRSGVAVPIQVQGSVVGLIEVFCSSPSAIDLTAIAGLVDVAKSFAALLIFDADNGGQPIIGGSLEHPIVLSGLIANQELTAVAHSGADVIEASKNRLVDLKVPTNSQLPSDRPTPTRVWLIAAVLLVGLSLLFLYLLKGA
jgi:GAF domain-containing protein